MPSDHPLRRILPLVDTALTDLLAEFAKLYAPIGRPSVRIRLVRPQGQSGVLPVVMHFHGGGSWNRPARFATPAALAAYVGVKRHSGWTPAHCLSVLLDRVVASAGMLPGQRKGRRRGGARAPSGSARWTTSSEPKGLRAHGQPS